MARAFEMFAHLVTRAVTTDAGAVLLGSLLAAYATLDLAEGAPARLRRERTEAVLVDRLGAVATKRAVARGRAMALEDACAFGRAQLEAVLAEA